MSAGKLRILLVGNYAPDRQESMQRFTDVFARHLPDHGFTVDCIRPQVHWNRQEGTSGKGKWLGYADKFLRFPKELRRHIAATGPDVVHVCDHSNAMYLRHAPKGRRLATCHDLLAVRSALGEIPQNPTRFTGRLLQSWIRRSLSDADRIVADSHATRSDVERLTPVGASRLSVVHVGLNYPYRRRSSGEIAEVTKHLGIPARFLLHVGGNQWYKNRPGVLRIVSKALAKNPSPPTLVMAGKAPTPELTALAAELKLPVVWVTDCDNTALECLYSGAELLLFPSLLEGFGWPIAEAMACGTAVLTSRRASMTEVGGELAYYVDPDDEAGAATVLSNALIDPDRSRRASAGVGWVRQFSTDRMLEQYAAIYRSMAESAAKKS